jgi:hypothetical protein
MMRKIYPSGRWLGCWAHAHEIAGGWAGRATIQALTPRAVHFYLLGPTAIQAGDVTAREHSLHSELRTWKENAQPCWA